MNYPTAPSAGGSRIYPNVAAITAIKASGGQLNKISINTTPTGVGGAYDTNQTATGTVDALILTNGGYGYRSVPAVTFSGGGGTGLAATALMSTNGQSVIGFTITNYGTGYTSAPTVAIAAPEVDGKQAAATAHLGGPIASNLIVAIPAGTQGIINADFPMRYGIVVNPGTGGVIAVSYT